MFNIIHNHYGNHANGKWWMYSKVPQTHFKWKIQIFASLCVDEKWSVLSIIDCCSSATSGCNVWRGSEYFKLNLKFHFSGFRYNVHSALWHYWLSDPLMSTEATSSLIKSQLREFNICTYITTGAYVMNWISFACVADISEDFSILFFLRISSFNFPMLCVRSSSLNITV